MNKIIRNIRNRLLNWLLDSTFKDIDKDGNKQLSKEEIEAYAFTLEVHYKNVMKRLKTLLLKINKKK